TFGDVRLPAWSTSGGSFHPHCRQAVELLGGHECPRGGRGRRRGSASVHYQPTQRPPYRGRLLGTAGMRRGAPQPTHRRSNSPGQREEGKRVRGRRRGPFVVLERAGSECTPLIDMFSRAIAAQDEMLGDCL